MKQDGFSLIELLVGMGLLGILGSFSIDLMESLYKKEQFSDAMQYTREKTDFISKMVTRDHRMMVHASEGAISVSDCDTEGVCGTLTIHRMEPSFGLKNATVTVQYSNTCRPMKKQTPDGRMVDTPLAGTYYPAYSKGQNSCVTRFLDCPAGHQRALQITTMQNGRVYEGLSAQHDPSQLKVNLRPDLRRYYAGIQLCSITDDESDSFRVLLQALVYNPYNVNINGQTEPKTIAINREIYLKQVSGDFSVQRRN